MHVFLQRPDFQHEEILNLRMIVPLVFSGIAGLNETFPEIPSPDPLIDSSGASI